MAITVDGKTYYRTAEVCNIAGISRTTLFRWLKNEVLSNSIHRDRRGWRLFTEEDLSRVKNEANRIVITDYLKDLDITPDELSLASKTEQS